MKIVYVIQRYTPAKLTGSEKVIETMAKTVAKQSGYKAAVISSDIEFIRGFYHPGLPRYKKREMVDGVQVTRLQMNWFSSSSMYVLNRFFPWLDRLTGGRMAFFAFGPHLMGLEQAIVNEKPDVIHTGPMPLYHVYACWRIARRHKIPLIVTPMMHFDVEAFHNPFIFSLLESCAQVTTFTQFEKGELVKRQVSADKITVVPATYIPKSDFTDGVGKKFRAAHGLTDEPIVAFLGTKAFDKGASHLLQAWPTVRKAVPNAVLVFAGLPTTAWDAELAAMENKDGIINLDYIGGMDKHDLLAAATALSVPSRTESFGIVIPEAWAKSKPVIVGQTGAARELIDEGKDGYRVGFGDVKDLAKKLIEVLSDPKNAAQIGKIGRAKAEKFNEKEYTHLLMDVYSKLNVS